MRKKSYTFQNENQQISEISHKIFNYLKNFAITLKELNFHY
jgi:hypothetical protein